MSHKLPSLLAHGGHKTDPNKFETTLAADELH
jgi:hypothetical protein